MSSIEKSSGQLDEWSPIYQAEAWYDEQGLNDQDIVNMSLTLVDPADIAPILGFNPGVPSILIPYPNESFPRVRRLGVSENKYMSPKGSGCTQPYLSNGFGIDWHDVKADTRLPVVIVEGEVKSYWGCKTGKLTIGMGGVQMQATLFDGSWNWKDRVVFGCFDHDEGQDPGQYKPGVANALGRLCSSLIEHGANVGVLHLGWVNPFPDKKCGLDDYLRAGGEWDALLKTAAQPPEWCEQLADMLEGCAYVVGTNHTHVYTLSNRSRKTPSDFHDAHIEKKRVTKGEDGKPVVKQVSRIWVEHPGRLTVECYDLNPLLPFGIQGDKINLWEGYPVFKLGSSDKTLQIKASWQKFMEGLFGEHWQWVSLWTGHLLNKPEQRTNQAIMLVTMVQGIGKSLFGDFIRDLTGKHGLEGKASRMFSNFNSEMEAKTFIMVNELNVKFSAKEGQMNDLLTEETVSIEQKGKDVVELPNLRRWYLTTNTSSPCRLSKGQRRVLVVAPPRVVADTRGEWGQWVDGVIAKFRRDPEALAAVREWFDDLWYGSGLGEGIWNPTAPVPQTQEADDMAEASMTVTQITAQHLFDWIQSQPFGWGAAHPDMRKKDVKAFGELTNLVKGHGGRVGQKKIKEDGVDRYYTIYDLNSKLEYSIKPSSGSRSISVESVEAKKRSELLASEHYNIQQILMGRS